jgi:tRNA threonylcarbamoyladenosine biosynthesis protein TsaB
MKSINILCIESSCQLCSVSISIKQEVFSVESKLAQNHAETLLGLIHDCLELANLSINDIQAVAISSGPGSYTGLRIGTSTAKGICFALGIPLISIDTLRSVAYGAKTIGNVSEGLIWPMIDARRMEVYHSVFDLDLNNLTEVKNGIIVDDGFVPAIVDAKTVICGDGAEKAELVLGLRRINITPHAKWLCEQAQQKYSLQDFENLEKFEPFYLKFANITVSNK